MRGGGLGVVLVPSRVVSEGWWSRGGLGGRKIKMRSGIPTHCLRIVFATFNNSTKRSTGCWCWLLFRLETLWTRLDLSDVLVNKMALTTHSGQSVSVGVGIIGS